MGHFAGLLLAVNAGTHQPRAASALPSQVALGGLQGARGGGSPFGSAGVSQPHLRAAPRASAQAPAGGQSRGAPPAPPGSTASPPSPVASRGGGRSAGTGSPRPSAPRAGAAGNFREVSGGKTPERARVPPVPPALP